MRKLPGEVQRHAQPMSDGTWRCKIEGSLDGLGSGPSEAEAHTAAEDDYEAKRHALLRLGEHLPEHKLVEEIADCLRLYHHAQSVNGFLHLGVGGWEDITLAQREVWRDKARHIIRWRQHHAPHGRATIPQEARGRDVR